MTAAFDAIAARHRHPAPDRRQDLARRAAGAVHDDARRRPGRPVRRVHNLFELRGLVRFARSRGLPHFLIGRGSDLVISDAGIRGLVIQNRAQGSQVEATRYIADSGVPMARAATETQTAGLSGLEFGLAIPGSVGGAVWANAGAHESDVARVLESARCCARTAGGRRCRGELG